MSDEQANRTVKATVFEDLFSDPQKQLELYKVLHPEDKTITVDSVEEITLTHIFLRGRYNDLGMMVRNRLILLVEAQSTWSVNIIPRCIMYLADTWNRYGVKHKFNWYGETKVELPEAELYVVYTGEGQIDKTRITLSEEFFWGKETSVNATVKVLHYKGGNDILDQYIAFCHTLNRQRKKYPDDAKKAVTETILICIEKGILKEYLEERGKEVTNIMLTLFTEEQARKMEIASERKEAHAEGREEGRINQAQETARKLYEMNLSPEKIAEGVGYSIDTVKKWLGILPA